MKQILILITIVIMTACSSTATNPNVSVLSPEQFGETLASDSNSLLLDVRTPQEYAAGHLEGAKLLDWLNQDAFRKEAPELEKEKTIYVYCRSGRRSSEAADYLASLGYKVVDMAGGIMAWERNGLKTVR